MSITVTYVTPTTKITCVRTAARKLTYNKYIDINIEINSCTRSYIAMHGFRKLCRWIEETDNDERQPVIMQISSGCIVDKH